MFYFYHSWRASKTGTLASIQILLFRGLFISSPVFSKLISALLQIPLSLPNPPVSASRVYKIESDFFRLEFCLFGYLFERLCFEVLIVIVVQNI
jgi:hypothetical protein